MVSIIRKLHIRRLQTWAVPKTTTLTVVTTNEREPNMSRRERLVVLPSLKAVLQSDGRIVVTEKFLDGMLEYVRYWEGPVATILEPAESPSNNLDNTAVMPDALPFAIEVLPFDHPRLADSLSNAAVALGGTDYRQNHLAALCRRLRTPFVVNAEYSLATRRQIAATEETRLWRRWRRYAWEWGQERAMRRSVALAAGVQCNGVPTFAAYRSLNPRCLLYFDTRMTGEMLPGRASLEERLTTLRRGEPLRLAFSGRLIAMKGADHLPRIADELRRLHVPFRMAIFGAGDLAAKIAAEIERRGMQECVELRGAVPFKTELMPTLQREVDLFVCPHRQGDPSCTYLETLACGVPIVGYDNEAWSGLLAAADVGAAASLDNPAALARAIARLDADRERVAALSRQAWDFARRNTFERTFEARIAHLRECAGLVPEVIDDPAFV